MKNESEFCFLTYNMAKARSLFRRRYILQDIRSALLELHADFIFLQEAHGVHPQGSDTKFNLDPMEALAEGLMPYKVYGQNAVYKKGHHGNAILSRYEIKDFENFDISVSPFAKRGLLHCILDLPDIEKNLHLFCVHLDLLEVDRREQVSKICSTIQIHTSENDLVLLAGDFNDWRGRIGRRLYDELRLEEVRFGSSKSARTFPSFFPVVSLDKIFCRGLEVRNPEILRGRPWSSLSDHLPLKLHFSI